MARKLPVLQRVLGAPTLFSVAYGEIASSIYFALGIIAGHALGLTPEVLLLTGLLFLVVALSYAEGITAIPETGGAATLVRKAFNDFAGFCTGWVLFLDYLIVITPLRRSSCRTTSAGRSRSTRSSDTRGTSSSAWPRSSPSPPCGCSDGPASTRPASAWRCSTS